MEKTYTSLIGTLMCIEINVNLHFPGMLQLQCNKHMGPTKKRVIDPRTTNTNFIRLNGQE